MAAPSLLLLAFIALSSVLLSLPTAAAVSSSGSSGTGLEWEIVTKKNYSSQIRLHPHILLMVTLPWSGEARSLRNKLSHFVTSKKEELGFLRLMVIYKNTDKMIADLLHANEEETTLFYYHFSTFYRYNGRLTPQSIMSSIYYIKSLELNEAPFKTLRTEEDIESFFLSTDKAVLLLDFCGWSAKLLQRNNDGKNGTSLSSQNLSENVSILGQRFGGENQVVETYYTENYKKDRNVEQTCPIENTPYLSPWVQEYTIQNRSTLAGRENWSCGTMPSCAAEDFMLFESFFINFTAITREYLLPPERHKFGLISEESLLSVLGGDRPNGWSILLHYSGCPNCSTIVHEIDDLRNFLLTQHPLVAEVTDGQNVDPAFPATRPSIILFVDRTSSSPKMREYSKSSLEVLRRFAFHNQIPEAGVDGTMGGTPLRTWRDTISAASAYQAKRDFLNPKTIKRKDNLDFMIINEGENISVKKTFMQDNSVYDILSQLLKETRSSLKSKETKISLVAKDAGFQLLSDDFDVQVLDSLPLDKGNDQANQAMGTASVDHSSQHSVEIDHVNTDNTGLLDNTEITVIPYEKVSGLSSDGLQGDQREISDGAIEDIILPVDEGMKVGKLTFEEKEIFEGNKFLLEKQGIFSGHEKSSIDIEKERPFSDENSQMMQEKTFDESLTPASYSPSLSGECTSSSQSSAEDVIASIGSSKERKISDELEYQHHPFPVSFFFSDGGYHLLNALTGDTKIPSLVILDPFLKQHYVLSLETNFSYTSLVSFIDKFLNGSLIPYRRLASSVKVPRDMPRPPFVNMDFHEADSIPQVTGSTFCELVIGYTGCEMDTGELFFKSKDLNLSGKTDVLVLFTSSGCGFCQRMELILREVYRAFKNFMNSSSNQKNDDLDKMKEKEGDSLANTLPSIYLMDCTHNDCGLILKSLGKKENYPMLLLFPAANKSAVSYEGDLSVGKIMEFLESHGSISYYLSKNRGTLWTPWKESRNENSRPVIVHQNSKSATEKSEAVVLATETVTDGKSKVDYTTSSTFVHEGPHVVTGSVLVATDKLNNAAPFDNSTILIVSADQNQGFHGVIINKPLSWHIVKKLGKGLESLKRAPLSYGGPVTLQEMPLVSLAREDKAHYQKVMEGVYFGTPIATRLALQRIKLGEQSSDEYWFFYGYSSWGYDQLYNDLQEGAWQLTISPVELEWPKSNKSEPE